MERDELRAHCLSKPGAWEGFPFGDDVAVYKVGSKIFALIPVRGRASISLKCSPTWALLLRDTYPAVTPGYHLNKRHWNTVGLDGSIPDGEIIEMIDHSYDLVFKSLTRKERDEIERAASA
jgi:predicted DNA-binding protein (MmcQ/YjbR family)